MKAMMMGADGAVYLVPGKFGAALGVPCGPARPGHSEFDPRTTPAPAAVAAVSVRANVNERLADLPQMPAACC